MEKEKLGVLLLHGWTGSTAMMRPLVEPIQALGLPVRIPVLTGHEKPIEALKKVRWEQWVEDVEIAMTNLLSEAEKAIVVGHSMGGMLALVLAGLHPDLIDSVITAGTPGRMLTPFAPGNQFHWLFNILWRLVPKIHKDAKNYADPECAKLDDSPDVAPTSVVNELFEFIKIQDTYLPKVTVPLLILHSRKDSAAAPESAEMIYAKTSTPTAKKQIVWFEKTDHGMFLDVEAKDVIETCKEFIQKRMQKAT